MTPELHHSQQSHSSNESTVSHLSALEPLSNNAYRPASRDRSIRVITPSTSLSDPSSQEGTGSTSPTRENDTDQSPSFKSVISNTPSHSLHKQTACPTSVKSHLPNISHAHKRTASGEVKRPGPSQPSSPDGPSQYSHSRNTSTASKSSQVSELSNDLRTRLSYAMFKVQNGLQSHSLNELEAMALRIPTTPSALSPLSPSIQSPTYRATHSPYSTEKAHSRQPISPNGPRLAHQSQQSNHPLASTPPEDARAGDAHYGPKLAPPVDFIPATSRRSRADNIQPPRLDTRDVHGNNKHDRLSPLPTSTTPATPPRKPASIHRTPNHKSTMEQDAVETLMFMSSPGNSGYHPAFHSPISPLPKHSMTSPNRGEFTSYGSRPPSNGRTAVSAPRLNTTAEIDRALDQMPDQYSSSDEDISFP
ncbi:MAG: hypothetical protein Q9182_003400 [Xanthomendoza sp. 2 TL-2023]